MGDQEATLQNILKALKETYCGNIAAEYMHVFTEEEARWIQERLESVKSHPNFSKEKKRAILKELIAADTFEKYLGKKYVGQKRFSLEGGDALIPLLNFATQKAGDYGVKETVISMAHRGRLNVLINVIGQSPQVLFNEFEGKKEYGETTGDVKYHLGFSADIATRKDPMHLSLTFNPSHLEIVSPVAMGSVRARQFLYNDWAHNEVMPITIHGDAAIAGQGVVMETLNMSQTRGYKVGGTVHVVINNQVGFTTSDVEDARSSRYCTDIAKMIEAPVFHVNGDDAEAVVFIAELAIDYRMKFKKDILIDLVCYRFHGHNEADEPSATQPLMYQKIRVHPVPYQVYAERLIAEKIVTQAEVEQMVKAYRDQIDAGQQVVKTLVGGIKHLHEANWNPYVKQDWGFVANTKLEIKVLKQLGEKLTTFPENFDFQRQVGNIVEARRKMAKGELPCDWGFAENLAYATLLHEHVPIRMSGQDVRRGTFAHRHAVYHDQKTGEAYCPLKQIADKPQDYEIYDSLLSEEAVLGFEYGYAKTDPRFLVLWEAQFGDFANGAQVIFDQFMSSGWQKWKRLCGLVVLLPHGLEGMGPEHSSARLERFLQLSGQYNMQVVVPTTPAQCYHMLRRQMLRPLRRPLIVMSPKSLLRHQLAVSSLQELAEGEFQSVIPEIDQIKNPKRIILCSGKVYYDLLTKRRETNAPVAIMRIEQLYPFPEERLTATLEKYKNVKDVIWCQEEPKNQGAWYSIRHHLEASLVNNQILHCISREAMAAPASGYAKLHLKEQQALVEAALNLA